MTKQNKRKGFTAIEMLVVIAVIAVLVSVVVPVVNGSNVKAKAATNAANLRAVEATISLKMLDNPEDFEAFFDKGEVLQKVSDGPLGKVYNFFFGDGDAEASRVKYDFLADNGKNQLQIPGSGLVISGLTLSKGLEAPRRDGGAGLTIDDGQGMRVCITEAGPLAFYGDYTKEDFADVAEDGYYDGMVTGTGNDDNNGWLPDWIENPVEEAICKSGLLENKHQTGPGCVCPYCGAEAHIDADKTTSWGMTEYLTSTSRHACRCGKVFNGDHVYEGSDHACKYSDCDKVTTCIDRNPESWRDEDDHKCYLCGGDNNHAWCTTDNKGGGTWGNPLPDHKCDTCGYVMSTCTIKEISNTQHQCTKCEVKSSHNFKNGVCECGAQQKTCKIEGCDRTDVQDDDHCTQHRLKDCTEKMNKRSWGEWQTCSGQYRVSTDDCTNKSNHLICKYPGCGETSNIDSEQYCAAEHYKKDCKETAKKTGLFGGTSYSECTGTYRGTSSSECSNAGNHHTHSYTTAVDAVYHKCVCDDKQQHNYVNGECTECHRKSHVVGTDCLDSNKDHKCDVNGCTNTTMGGAHTTNTNLNNGYHGCSYCTKDRVACSEGDKKDHKCDTCGYAMSKCEDSDPKDQKCDTCDAPMGGGGGSCVTPDTLITLADGSKKRVDQLDGSEELLVWNLETGAYDSAPIMFIDSEAECEAEVIYLHFSDGTLVKVITEHGFWDYTLNMYVYLDRGAEAYIGHTFFKQSENGGEKVELVDVEFKTEVTTAWSPVTVGHLCYFVNDMLSMPGGISGLFNIFDVDPETMAYDYEAMARDIETYGLLSYEELSSVIAVPEDMFNAAGGAYLNIAMGKGQLTEGELFAMIQRYSVHFE